MINAPSVINDLASNFDSTDAQSCKKGIENYEEFYFHTRATIIKLLIFLRIRGKVNIAKSIKEKRLYFLDGNDLRLSKALEIADEIEGFLKHGLTDMISRKYPNNHMGVNKYVYSV